MKPGTPTGLVNQRNFMKQQLQKRLTELQYENAALSFHVLAPLIKKEYKNVFSGGSNLLGHMTVTRNNRTNTYRKIKKVREEMANIKRKLNGLK